MVQTMGTAQTGNQTGWLSGTREKKEKAALQGDHKGGWNQNDM
jgi:hypothetical protein